MSLNSVLRHLGLRIAPRDLAAAHPHFFDALESRVLLSASFDAGVLTIQGTSDSDVIQLNAGANPGEVIVVAAPDVERNTLFGDVTQIVIEGFEGSDTIRLAPNLEIDAQIDAGEGNNAILGGGSDDTITAGNGNNIVVDRAGNNVVNLGDGNNRVITGEGDDSITTGAGNDLVVDRGGANVINVGEGNNRVITGTGDDSITTGAGNDLVVDRGGNNTINAGDGNNRVIAGAGDDSITAGAGNDLIVDRGGNNTVDAGDGNNRAITGAGNDNISAGVGNDVVVSRGGNNAVNVLGGNNRVVTGAGDDEVNTGDGEDRIVDRGGNGNRVSAGAGNDVVVVSDGDNTLELGDGDDRGIAGRGHDRIFGGRGHDNIRGRAGDHIDDEPGDRFEAGRRNNSVPRATRVELGSDRAAALTGSLVWHRDHRFYLYTAEIDGELHLDLQTVSGATPEVQVKTDLEDEQGDEDGDVLLLELGEDDSSGSVDVVAGQTYIIKVWSGGPSGGAYELDLALAPGSTSEPVDEEPADVVAEVEPNDSNATATLFELGSDGGVQLTGVSDSSADDDVFGFTADQDRLLNIAISGDATLVDLDVEDLDGPAGLALSPSADGVSSGQLAVTAGQSYFLRLASANDLASSYLIDVTEVV